MLTFVAAEVHNEIMEIIRKDNFMDNWNRDFPAFEAQKQEEFDRWIDEKRLAFIAKLDAIISREANKEGIDHANK